MKKSISPLVGMAIACISPMMVHGSRVAFVTPSHSRVKFVPPITPSLLSPITIQTTHIGYRVSQQKTTTSLQMGYQLPPSPQGPKGPLDELKAILPTITTGILIALFFASPLGGIFFALFNSIFVLALLTPFVLFGGFKLWSALYTVEAPCPSCGVIPVRVLKDGEPSVCLNCGAYSRANEKGDGLELCNNPNDMMGGGGTLFDALFGPNAGIGNEVSDFGGGVDFSEVMGGPKKENSVEEQAKKAKRQGTIIDVDVERD